MKLSLNRKLAFLAFTLSFMALVNSVFFIDGVPSEITSEIKYITVLNLADSIKNREVFTLIDLRSNSDFNQFHIPTAKNKSIQQLLSTDFTRETKLVIYSERDSLANQAFFMLKRKGIEEIKVVKGGVQDWYNRILYPRMPKIIPEEDKVLANEVKALTAYFGGHTEFVDNGNPLNYYKTQQSNQPVIKSKLVRMGC